MSDDENGSLSSAPPSESDSDSDAHTPPVTIRRPIDIESDSFTSSSSSSSSLDSSPPVNLSRVRSSFRTPVIITPVNRRSTRELTRLNRLRRARRTRLIRQSGFRLNNINRRLSLAPSEASGIGQQLLTPANTEDVKKTLETSAVERDAADNEFQMMLNTVFGVVQSSPADENQPSSQSPNVAKVREINRLEAVEEGHRLLESNDACLDDIQDAIARLERNLSHMADESRLIDRILEDCVEEQKSNEQRWSRIEEIMRLMREG